MFFGLLSCSQLQGIADVFYEVKETVGGVSVEMLREILSNFTGRFYRLLRGKINCGNPPVRGF